MIKVSVKRANGTRSPVAIPLPVLPCVHVGQPAGPAGWHYCDHPDDSDPRIPAGDLVCGTGCNGKCTPRCPGYAAVPLPPTHPNILAADQFARTLPPYPEGQYSGRGVVIVGGGKYWSSVYVTVRMLRHTGCQLPVQVWYLGEQERDDRYTALLSPFGVEVVDTLAHPAASATRGLTGFPDPSGRNGPTHPPFEAKSFAVLHSPYEEVLSLDADNYPCADVSPLFDDSRYRLTGGIFWPDKPQTEGWTRWKDWGVEAFHPVCGWEVGAYVIHKRIAWRQLNLMRWYDDHGDWCYGWGAHHDHGDKGPPRIAWAKFQTVPTFFSTVAVWDRVAFIHPGPDGTTPMLVHRCQGKLVLESTAFASTPQLGVNQRCGLPGEDAAFGYLEELRNLLLG